MTEELGLWVYPLRLGQDLEGHKWAELRFNKLLDSSFVAHAIREGRRADIGTALLLWAASFRQDPAGTLPDDDVELAQLAKFGADVEGWLAVRKSVLHKWTRTLVETDAGDDVWRLGHPFIAELAVVQYGRKKANEESGSNGRRKVRRSRVKQKMDELGHKRLADNGQAVEAVLRWLETNGQWITDQNVARALEEAVGVPRVVATIGGAH